MILTSISTRKKNKKSIGIGKYRQDWIEHRLVVGKMQRKCVNDSTALNACIYLQTFIAKVYKTAIFISIKKEDIGGYCK